MATEHKEPVLYVIDKKLITDVWDQKTFQRKDGQPGTVQTIKLDKSKNLILWDLPVLPKDKIGLLLSAGALIIKKNQRGYDEFNTTFQTTVTFTPQTPQISQNAQPSAELQAKTQILSYLEQIKQLLEKI